MSLATLPLSYCTNVHPARTAEDVFHGLNTFAGPVRAACGFEIAAGLWLADSVARQLEADPPLLARLGEALQSNGLQCYTLNAFPFGDFHGERVKEGVYLPDWTTDARRDYSLRCAAILAELLPPGVEGSISTLPLGFKAAPKDSDFQDRCIAQLLAAARRLDEIHDESGRVIRLAIEPEPLCVLETTSETIDFFRTLYDCAETHAALDVARRHLGVCYDVCHQSVEFEDVTESLAALHKAEIRINKVHITCALRLPAPGENVDGREALAAYAEPRYLHQTVARGPGNRILSRMDLDREFCQSPPAEFLDADEWRIHFHVPVHAERLGPLLTTRDDLKAALSAVARLDYAPHLEVETYTWGVLPGRERPSLVEGLVEELRATRKLLDGLTSGIS